MRDSQIFDIISMQNQIIANQQQQTMAMIGIVMQMIGAMNAHPDEDGGTIPPITDKEADMYV